LIEKGNKKILRYFIIKTIQWYKIDYILEIVSSKKFLMLLSVFDSTKVRSTKPLEMLQKTALHRVSASSI
jgi:hypothetical protein